MVPSIVLEHFKRLCTQSTSFSRRVDAKSHSRNAEVSKVLHHYLRSCRPFKRRTEAEQVVNWARTAIWFVGSRAAHIRVGRPGHA